MMTKHRIVGGFVARAYDVTESAKGRALVVGVGRAMDPNPIVDVTMPVFEVAHMMFDLGLEVDSCNLQKDREKGESKLLSKFVKECVNGKVSFCP